MSWKRVKLDSITNNLDGKRIPLNELERKEKESNKIYPYVGANNILGYIDDYIFDEKILCVAEDGGSWGKDQKCCFIINEKCWVNNHAHVLTAKNEVSLEYLMYYLNHTDLNKHITGTTRGKLTKSSLNSIEVPLPPLTTQQKIAAILDKADELRRKDKALLEKYDALLQSIFYKMFGDPVKNEKGWEIKRVKDVLIDIVSGSSYGGEDKELNEDEIGVLKVSAVTWGEFRSSEYKAVKKKEVTKKIISPKKGDLLFSRANTRELVAATCIVDNDYPNLFLPDKLWRIDLDLKLCNQHYFKYLLSDSKFRLTLTKTATGTSGSMLNVSMEKLKALKIPIPQIELQNKFEKLVLNIRNQKLKLKQQVTESDNLFQTLLQKAFKGELVK